MSTHMVPPTGLTPDIRVTVSVAVVFPSATKESTRSGDAASTAFLSSATNLDSAVFVDS